MSSARGALAAMVLATLLWGGTFVVLRDALVHIAPTTLVFARFAIASLLFAPLLIARRGAAREAAPGGALAGGLAAGGFLFQAIGLTATSAGSSAFLTCAGTLLAGFAAWPLLGQRPSRDLVLGVALALAGTALISLRSGLHVGRGEAWTLLGAGCYALQVVALARFAPRRDPFALAGMQSLAITLVLSPWALPSLRALPALHADQVWRLAYLVLAGSVAAPLLHIHAQRILPAGRVGLLFALEPVFALGFALGMGAERFAARWWCGTALILAAVLLVEGRASRRPAGAPRATG